MARTKKAPEKPESKVFTIPCPILIPNSPHNQYPKTLPNKPEIIFPNKPKPLPAKIMLTSHPNAAPNISMMTISIMKFAWNTTFLKH